MKKLKPLVWLSGILLVVSMFAIVACQTGSSASSSTSAQSSASASSSQSVAKPEPNKNGIITADQWAATYPDVYESYQMNIENSKNENYLEEAPWLKVIYKGSGFGNDYKSARSHLFTLTDVAATARPHAAANCLTCKSPEFTAMVNAQGVGMYSKEFGEIYGMVTESVSCYNCHENTGDQQVITHEYLKNALGADVDKVDPKTAVCGQCHNEYYFNPETKAVTLPWVGLSNMNPDAMLAYYNDMWFVDYKHAISGTDIIKVQHPEMETVLGSGSKIVNNMGFSCADCHMAVATNDAGEEYASHYFMSPLKNADLVKNTCNVSGCHVNVVAQATDNQNKVLKREEEVGKKLADLHEKTGAAAEAGKTDDELKEVRDLIRDAQFYWDFVRVENSYGAHNSTLAMELLNKADRLIDQALAKL